MGNQKRIDEIDFFRGIGILLMIMLHVGFGAELNIFGHAFHMPMFFILSGFFFSACSLETLKQRTRNNARKLLIPYFSFAIINWIVWLILNKEEYWLNPILHVIWDNGSDKMSFLGPLWFLLSLFICQLIYGFLSAVIKSEKIIGVCCVCIGLAGFAFSPEYLDIFLPWSLRASFVGVLFMYFGEMLKRKDTSRILNLHPVSICIGYAAIAVLIFVNGMVNMRINQYGNVFLFIVNAVCATILGLNASRRWYRFSLRNHFLNSITNAVSSVGRNSVTFLCLNSMVIHVLKIVIDKLRAPLFVRHAIVLCLTLLMLWGLDAIIRKTKLKILLGKR